MSFERKPFDFDMTDKTVPLSATPLEGKGKPSPPPKKKAATKTTEKAARTPSPVVVAEPVAVLSVRISRSLHQAVKLAALQADDQEIQLWVIEALNEKLEKGKGQ